MSTLPPLVILLSDAPDKFDNIDIDVRLSTHFLFLTLSVPSHPPFYQCLASSCHLHARVPGN